MSALRLEYGVRVYAAAIAAEELPITARPISGCINQQRCYEANAFDPDGYSVEFVPKAGCTHRKHRSLLGKVCATRHYEAVTG